MKSLAAVDHPNVVAATDAGEDPPWHYLVMRYVDGVDLSQVIDAVGTVDVATACAIGARVAAALSALHDAGLVHRDIKPSNIMLTRDGQVQLLDFGLAGDAADRLGDASRLTTVGQVVGTVLYASPEQLAGETLDARSDLYSLGVTLYRLITGRHPHGTTGDASLVEVLHAKTTRDAEPPFAPEGKVPGEVADLLMLSLHRGREMRPGGAASLAKTLARHADERGLRAVVKRVSNLSGTDAVPMLPTIAPESAGGRSAVKWLVGASGLAAVLFGVLLTLKTDEGTLVVRSEGDGEVRVEPIDGDGAVRELRVRSGDNRTVVTAGRYRITAPPGAEIEFSPAEVVVEGGGEALVDLVPNAALSDAAYTESVRSLAEQTGLTPEDLRRTSAGLSVAEHLRRIRFDMDVQTITESTRAVLPLLRPDNVELGQWLFRPTRMYGGRIAGGGNPSGRYMDSFDDEGGLVTALMPEPGLRVFAEEFREGNERSRAAALYALNWGFDGDDDGFDELIRALDRYQKVRPAVEHPWTILNANPIDLATSNVVQARHRLLLAVAAGHCPPTTFTGLKDYLEPQLEWLADRYRPSVNSLERRLERFENNANRWTDDDVFQELRDFGDGLLHELRSAAPLPPTVELTVASKLGLSLPSLPAMDSFVGDRIPNEPKAAALRQALNDQGSLGVMTPADAFVAVALARSRDQFAPWNQPDRASGSAGGMMGGPAGLISGGYGGGMSGPPLGRSGGPERALIDDWVRPGVRPPWFDVLPELARRTSYPRTLRQLLRRQVADLRQLGDSPAGSRDPSLMYPGGGGVPVGMGGGMSFDPNALRGRYQATPPGETTVNADELIGRFESVIDGVLNKWASDDEPIEKLEIRQAEESEMKEPFEDSKLREEPGGMF